MKEMCLSNGPKAENKLYYTSLTGQLNLFNYSFAHGAILTPIQCPTRCWDVLDVLCGCIGICMKKLDPVIKVCEPYYAALAAALVTLDAYVFFTSVLQSVHRSQGAGAAGAHALFGAWLLFCVLWNHACCILTPPAARCKKTHMLQAAMTFDWRWCRKCNKPKPPLAHHCSICKRCILRMDHHCPWMANCIGHHNYHYFFLYLFYMWVGASYSLLMTYNHIPDVLHSRNSTWRGRSFLAFMTFLLAIAVFLATFGLLCWHVFLILTGQGTIDALSNYWAEKEAILLGVPWSNPYDLGPVKNWQHTFDSHGRLWWLTWMLPSLNKKAKEKGWQIPRAKQRAGPSSVPMTPLEHVV